MEYGLIGDTHQVLYLHGGKTEYAAGSRVHSSLLNCCGLIGMDTFGRLSRDLSVADRCRYIASLYEQYRYTGHMLYCISSAQAAGNWAVLEHKLFLAMGSTKIAEFKNLVHGPNMIQLWLVNLRDAVGVYCDVNGKAYDAPVPPKPVEVAAAVAKPKARKKIEVEATPALKS